MCVLVGKVSPAVFNTISSSACKLLYLNMFLSRLSITSFQSILIGEVSHSPGQSMPCKS